MTEIWRPVRNFENLYAVSNLGQIKSLDRVMGGKIFYRKEVRLGRILSPKGTPGGYLKVSLCKNGIKKTRYLHQLIAEAHIGPRPNKCVVNHRDGDKLNNNLSNLEWVTYSENIRHAYRHGLQPTGEQHHQTKHSNEKIYKIRALLEEGILTQEEIGRVTGVGQAYVSQIKLKQVRNYA